MDGMAYVRPVERLTPARNADTVGGINIRLYIDLDIGHTED